MTTRYRVAQMVMLAHRYPEHFRRLPPTFTLAELVEMCLQTPSAIRAITVTMQPDAEDVDEVDTMLMRRLWEGRAPNEHCNDLLVLWLYENRSA